MLLVKIMGVWVAVRSGLGDITLVQALGLTIKLLGGLGRSTCPLCFKSKGMDGTRTRLAGVWGAQRGGSGQRGGKEVLTRQGSLC